MKKIIVGKNFLHSHPTYEKAHDVSGDHVIIDKTDLEAVQKFFEDYPEQAEKIFESGKKEKIINVKDNNQILTGVQLIAKEREEQIEKHGHTVEKDITENKLKQLTDAAIMLLMTDRHKFTPPSFWKEELWKRMINKSEKERYIISGALLAAQIDLFQATENIKEKKFIEFWFDSNQYFGKIKSMDELQNVYVLNQMDGNPQRSPEEFLKACLQHHDNTSLNFGLRLEHTGTKSLYEFLIENNIEIDMI